jgi:hypothetical protein
MAFGGSFGKLFGITSGEAARIGTSFATGGIGAGLGTFISSLGGDGNITTTQPVDVSGPPAGVDSPATVSRVSQTSQIMPPPITGAAEGFGGRVSTPQQAFIGGFGLPGVVSGAARLLSRPGVGGALTGFGAGAAVDFVVDMFGNQKKLVITRKLQRDVKKVFMMAGGDIGFISSNSMMLFGKSLSEDQILMILFKTFKNQGPYVTKAAVRKTRQTIRKMETLCDLKDRLCPPKPARRRAPARRMSTSITQVK